MLPLLSAAQLHGWQQYHSQHGIAVDRDDIHWGMLLSMFYNANRGEGSEPRKAEDFMPYREPVEESDEDFVARIKSIMAAKCQ